jgi:signal transduction histidine kinase
LPAIPSTAVPPGSPRNSGPSAIFGSGEMAGRIRAFDWASTAVGPIEQWEDALLTTVNLMLASRHAMFLFWGDDLIQVYNDAYRATLDDLQHPLALGNHGRISWANIWPIIGPQLNAVMSGEALYLEDQFIPGRRSGPYEDSYWNYSYTPVRNIAGVIRGVFVVCTDTTTTVLARNVVEKEKQRLADLFEQAPAFFAVLRGPSHIFELTNSSYQQLIGNREVLGKTVVEALPEAIGQGFGDLLDQVYSTGKPYVGRNIPFSLDPSGASGSRYLDFIYQPMREITGAISGILVFGVDVTEGHRAQRMLIQTEKLAAVGQMASTIAHEINNPLESVTNLLFLARQLAETAQVKEYLDLADQELRRIAAISSQTLRFHRQLTSPTEVRCDALFSSSLVIYERRIQNLSIRVEKRMRATKGVLCYQGEIRQVLNNLIGNALDALSAGGRILLRSADATDPKTGRRGLRMTVADNGSGISPQVVKSIFDAFFTTKGFLGTGLGLWICQDIVTRHGGYLHVRSSQRLERHGSVFYVFLPFDAVSRN